MPSPSGFLTIPMKEHIGEKYCCKQCGKNFSYLLFLEKKYAKFLVTLFAMMVFSPMCSFMGLVRNPLGAGKWLLSCVCPFMLLQITILLKCFITLGTCKWLLSCMLPFMHLQTSSVNKTLVAHGTGKWLLSSVGTFMHLQILPSACSKCDKTFF